MKSCNKEGGYWIDDVAGRRFDPCLGCSDCGLPRSGDPVFTSGTRKAGYHNTQGGEQQGPTWKTQKEAVEAGRVLAVASRAEHVIKGHDGKIRTKNSYGNDPRGNG